MVKSRDPNAGFDSLLDTMTNAVGVLIIVLAVSFLAMRDAVHRVNKLQPVSSRTTEDQLRQMQATANRQDNIIKQLRFEWKAAHGNAQYSRAQQDMVREKSNMLIKRLGQQDFSHIDVREVSHGLQKDRAELLWLEDEVNRLKQQAKHVRSAVGLQRKLPKPKVTVARVPDPVPAPIGAKRLTFLCRYGHVVYYPPEEMLSHLYRGIAQATGTGTLSPRLEISDFRRVVDHFQQNEFGQDGMRWRLRVIQRLDQVNAVYRELRASLVWSDPNSGETLDQIQKEQSKYRKIITEAATKDVYVKYYVWGDSFIEYAVARELADENNIPAGWVALEGDAEYQIVLMSTQTGKPGYTVESPQRVPLRIPVQRMRIGIGSSPSSTPVTSTPSFGVIGASPGVDHVD